MKKLNALLLLVLLSGMAGGQNTGEGSRGGGLAAMSEGGGLVKLFWFPVPGQWPAGGFRLLDAAGKVLADRLIPGVDTEALNSLSAEDRTLLADLSRKLASAKSPADIRSAYGVLAVKAASDRRFAKAAGLAADLAGQPGGLRVYSVVPLDANGRPSGPVMSCPPIDAAKAGPRPPAPLSLSGVPSLHGLRLFWKEPPDRDKSNLVGYAIERESPGSAAVSLLPGPLLVSRDRMTDLPVFVDAQAPEEQALVYRIFGVDLFGRRGAPAELSIYNVSLAALQAPARVDAKSDRGVNTVTWKPNASRFTAHYVVERGVMSRGPYETLTPQGLDVGKERYDDRDLQPGTTYYYRIRSANARGDVGSPSAAAMVRAVGAAALPGPKNLRGHLGATFIHLEWDAPAAPVAGYLVERRAGSVWQRLNANLSQVTTYDDRLGREFGGTYVYRVVAVGPDEQLGEPSASLEVQAGDPAPIPVPAVETVESRGGRAVVRLVPIEKGTKNWALLILRSGSAGSPGLALSPPLGLDTREWVDDRVQAGVTYWYRVQAVHESGLTSPLSAAVPVRVGDPALPRPAKPSAAYAAEPFPHVLLQFDEPPAGIYVVIERKAETDKFWTMLLGPGRDHEAADPNPPASGSISYRLVYQSASGAQGDPSPEVRVLRR